VWRHATWSLRLSKNDVVEGVYSWASKLAAENRDLTSGNEIYVPHKLLIWIEERLKLMKGSIVGIVGLQGVGKSHVLMMLSEFHKIGGESNEVIFFKWRRESDILKSLLGGNHEASIGSHLAERLLEKGCEVVGLDDLSSGKRAYLAKALQNASRGNRKLTSWTFRDRSSQVA